MKEKLWRPMITREHGSWAVLSVPMVIGLVTSGQWRMDALWAALAILGMFLCYVPAQVLIRSIGSSHVDSQRFRHALLWGAIYAVLTLLPGVALIRRGLSLLIPLAFLAGFAFSVNATLVRKYGKSAFSDLVAVAGLTLGAPAMCYVMTGSLDARAMMTYLLNLLFFGCGVFYVHMKMEYSAARNRGLGWREKLSMGRLNLLYHLFALALVAVLTMVNHIPFLVLLAYFPMAIHAICGTVRLSYPPHYRKIGLILLGESIFFALLVSVAQLA